mgnify:CR=1 FL=1
MCLIMFTYKKFNRANEYLDEVVNLYETAFPIEERFPMDDLLDFIDQGLMDFDAIYLEEDFIGITATFENELGAYLIYFAVKEEHRNKGYGSIIISSLINKYKNVKPLIIAIESLDKNALDYKLRCRRCNFYTRNGFTYIQNMYIREYEVTYDVMASTYFEPSIYMSLMGFINENNPNKEKVVDCYIK